MSSSRRNRHLYPRHKRKPSVKHKQRRQLIKHNGGSHTDDQWFELCEKYHHRCLGCGANGKMTKDHIIPICKGGTSDINNLQPLCDQCNQMKGDMIIDFRDEGEFPVAEYLRDEVEIF